MVLPEDEVIKAEWEVLKEEIIRCRRPAARQRVDSLINLYEKRGYLANEELIRQLQAERDAAEGRVEEEPEEEPEVNSLEEEIEDEVGLDVPGEEPEEEEDIEPTLTEEDEDEDLEEEVESTDENTTPGPDLVNEDEEPM